MLLILFITALLLVIFVEIIFFIIPLVDDILLDIKDEEVIFKQKKLFENILLDDILLITILFPVKDDKNILPVV